MRLAASSARTLTDSGSRRVIRDWLSSSGSGGAGVAGSGGRLRLGLDPGDHELRLAAAHPHVDGLVVEVAGDLGGGLRQRFEQHHPGGGIEGEGEALGGGLGLGATRGGGVGEVAAEALDEGREFHDAMVTPRMTSCQEPNDVMLASQCCQWWCRVRVLGWPVTHMTQDSLPNRFVDRRPGEPGQPRRRPRAHRGDGAVRAVRRQSGAQRRCSVTRCIRSSPTSPWAAGLRPRSWTCSAGAPAAPPRPG